MSSFIIYVLMFLIQSSSLKGYFDDLSNLFFAVGGVIGLIGGLRVYINWNTKQGYPVISQVGNWLYGALLLCIIGATIKIWFGVL